MSIRLIIVDNVKWFSVERAFNQTVNAGLPSDSFSPNQKFRKCYFPEFLIRNKYYKQVIYIVQFSLHVFENKHDDFWLPVRLQVSFSETLDPLSNSSLRK